MREILAEIDPDILLADGFDEALVGTAERCGMDTVALYDIDKCIEILMQRDDMTYEEAVEFFDFNVLGAYMGEKTPMFAQFYK